MFTAHAVITVTAIVAHTASAVVDLVKPRFLLTASADAGVPESWFPWLAALKAAGATGLLLGLLGAHGIATAAAVGLVLYFVGAVAVNVRARALPGLASSGGFLALSVACLAVTVTR
ncbi:DoxX family protein [Streptomyces sp. NPDC018031]|uniref:DoxX family protein n=1 Tax=Streptomyces sp. NPDC018031 TaxID=3365033 RepID=UPI0037B101D4